jgi:hypothetical protein
VAAPRREAPERDAQQPSAEPLRRPVRPEAPAATVERRAPERDRSASRAAAAEALATEYLNTWSAPNGLTLDSTTSFYGRRVTFHGRTMSPGELLDEKRRFVRRWPEREYQPRLSTMGTACSPQGRSCTVRSVFDFAAANPAEGRRTQGVGTLELVVSFAEGRPVIVAENSVVHGRSARRSALRESRDE